MLNLVTQNVGQRRLACKCGLSLDYARKAAVVPADPHQSSPVSAKRLHCIKIANRHPIGAGSMAWNAREPRRSQILGKDVETALYLPVKRFLESLGFSVKGEIGGCDIVAIKDDDPPVVVIGELKLTFSLELILQGVERAAACDEVWLAAKLSKRGKGRESDARFRNLCRRLGFGMLGITDGGLVEVLVEPAIAAPRRNPRKRARLVLEHQKRRGDPSAGGSTRAPIMTAYRQRALACAFAMSGTPQRLRDLRADVPEAGRIIADNHYEWFCRVDRGIYTLTEAGRSALERWPQAPDAALQPAISGMEPKNAGSVTAMEPAEE